MGADDYDKRGWERWHHNLDGGAVATLEAVLTLIQNRPTPARAVNCRTCSPDDRTGAAISGVRGLTG